MEEWKPVKGYDGYYEVSNYGTVRGVKRVVESSKGYHEIPQRVKKAMINQDGYAIVSLSRDGKSIKRAVHRLVYEAFVGVIPDGYEINHKDFDRANNCVSNLEAVTHTENVQYTVAFGRNYTSKVDTSGESNPNFGNTKLSEIYRANPEMAREKQGRPGLQNGRCRRIRALSPDGEVKEFGCVKDCAQYLIDCGISSGTPGQVYTRIWKSIKDDATYRGHKFQYI